jgi:protocatechuate 3,4-dioxygenase beta subunit
MAEKTMPENNPSTRYRSKTTPEVEEGPYYKAGSPERAIIYEAGVPGERLTLTGYVYDTKHEPVAHAWLDFWQANGRGRYDNADYILRGHQYTSNEGKYTLETVVPGGYAGRTPHIHVKVRAREDSPILTTQLFIPGIASNATDFLYKEALLVNITDLPDHKIATFDFMIKTGGA